MLVRPFDQSVWWLALPPDRGALWVGLSDGAVHELDSGSLEPRRYSRLTNALLWLLPLDAERAIAGDGAALQFVALPGQRELELRGELPGLPEHGPVHLAALSPDRRHIALAAGGHVRIAVVE